MIPTKRWLGDRPDCRVCHYTSGLCSIPSQGTLWHTSPTLNNNQKCADGVWWRKGRDMAANGAVMRTSILGCLQYSDLKSVASNAASICKVRISSPLPPLSQNCWRHLLLPSRQHMLMIGNLTFLLLHYPANSFLSLRCIASCVVVSTIIALLLRGKHESADGRINVKALLAEVTHLGKQCLFEEHKEEFLLFLQDSISLDQLQLDEKKRIG